MNKPRTRKEFRALCREYGLNPNSRKYFDSYSIGEALWKAFMAGRASQDAVSMIKLQKEYREGWL